MIIKLPADILTVNQKMSVFYLHRYTSKSIATAGFRVDMISVEFYVTQYTFYGNSFAHFLFS